MATNESNVSVLSQYDVVLTKLRGAQAVTHQMSMNPDLDTIDAATASLIWEIAKEAEDALKAMLEAWRDEKNVEQADEPKEWTGASMEKELRALAKRIIELPQSGVAELMSFVLNVNSAKLNERDDSGESNDITLPEIKALLAQEIRPEHVSAFWWLKHKGVVALVPEGDRAPTPDELHVDTIREIREEYPDADEREVNLRVAIRESIAMTPDEEDKAYDLIAAAVNDGAAELEP
jgi:hypothetical protein